MYEVPNQNVQDVISVIKELPNITSRELYTFVPQVPKGTVSSIMHSLKAQGVITTTGYKTLPTLKGERSFVTYAVSDNATPPVRNLKLKQPTDAGIREQMKELRRKISELEAWKEAAMSRFPDLAVSQVVITARKLVADEVRAGGDMLLANQIIEGKKDETLLVRVAIKALEESND